MPELRRLLRNLRVVIRNPRFLGRVLLNYTRAVVLRQRVLRKFQIAVTFGCPCSCEHCSADWMIQRKRKPLSTEEIINAIDQALDLGAITVILTGGEPLLRNDLEDIIAAVPKRKAMVSINTSAAGLTPARIDRLVAAGLSSIAISLDSSIPELHNRRRGVPDLYRQATEAMRYAKKAGLYVQITTVITPTSVKDGDVFRISDLAESLGIDHNVIWSGPVGGWADRRDLLFSQEDIDEVYEKLLSKPHVRWQGTSNYLHDGCQAGREKIYLTELGEATPCDGIPVSFGNITTTPLKQIWEKMRRVPDFDQIQPHCIVATQGDFYDQVIAPLSRYKSDGLPIRAEAHPMAARWGLVPND